MKILVLGNQGQLASAFRSVLKENATYISKENFLQDEIENLCVGYEIIINCFAYTNVEMAETDKEESNKLNASLPQRLGNIANKQKIKLIHFSTDYVFDGLQSKPYQEQDKTNPTSVYGHSKLQGEMQLLRECPQATIFRTSWLHGDGQNNFISKIKKKLESNEIVNVVYDQVGSLTLAVDLAANICENLEAVRSSSGIYHYAGKGVCSWYDIAYYLGKKMNKSEFIFPVTSEQLNSKVRRPHYSVLDSRLVVSNLSFNQRHWIDAIDKILGEHNS